MKLLKLIFYVFSLLLPISGITESALFHSAVTHKKAFSQNSDNSDIFKVFAPDKSTMIKAQISFHNQLLEVHHQPLYAWMQLSLNQQKQLTDKGFILLPDDNWLHLRQQQLKNRVTVLQKSGVSSSRLIESCYLTVEETYAQAEKLHQTYPQLTKWIDIGNSWKKVQGIGGYDLMVLKISNKNIQEDKPKVFIQSSMHARELTPAQLSIDFAGYLLSQYQKDADITWLINHREIHFLFQANPDGRKKAEQNFLWRKNTNALYCATSSSNQGADLNRNFSMFWNSNHLATNNTSDEQCSEVYRGPTASSEPETRAVEAYVRSLFPDDRGPALDDAPPIDKSGLHLDLHSFGHLLLWPWGQTKTLAPNNSQFQIMAHRIAFYNQYLAEKSDGLYPTDGTSDNVSYGELGVAALTFELGSEFFESCANYEINVKPHNFDALIYAIKIAQAPYQIPQGPDSLLTSVLDQGNGTYLLQIQADDNRSFSLLGKPVSHNIIDAEYSIDVPISNINAQINSMSVSDGLTDNSIEDFNATIDTSNLSQGRHQIYFHARNSTHQWGPTTTAFIDLGNLAPFNYFYVQCNQLDCNFDGSPSFDKEDSLLSFLWDFGDGSSSTLSKPNHQYATSSQYHITLNVTDSQGVSTTRQSFITPGQPIDRPTVNFSTNCTALSCQFDASASTDNLNIVNYLWDFGDGTAVTGQMVQHTYSKSGNFQVNLTLTNEEGNQSVDSKLLSVEKNNPVDGSETSNGSSGGGGVAIFILGWLLCYRKFRFKFR